VRKKEEHKKKSKYEKSTNKKEIIFCAYNVLYTLFDVLKSIVYTLKSYT